MSASSSPRGWRWFCAALHLFAQRPFLFLAMPVCVLLLTLPIRLIPYVGVLLPELIWLCLSVGTVLLALCPRLPFLAISRAIRKRLLPLTVLALLLLGYTTLALYLLTWIDPEFITGLLQHNLESLQKQEAQNPASILRLILLFIPLLLAQWFTPILIVWRRYSIGKALFFNFAAIWRNLRDILLVCILYVALVLGMIFLLGLLSTLVTNLNVLPLLFLWSLAMGLHFCLLCVLYQDFFPIEKPAHISETA
jgi:hypothetical protein